MKDKIGNILFWVAGLTASFCILYLIIYLADTSKDPELAWEIIFAVAVGIQVFYAGYKVGWRAAVRHITEHYYLEEYDA